METSSRIRDNYYEDNENENNYSYDNKMNRNLRNMQNAINQNMLFVEKMDIPHYGYIGQ